MKSVGYRVRRLRVDFTDHTLVSGPVRMFEQMLIKSARAAASDHDPVQLIFKKAGAVLGQARDRRPAVANSYSVFSNGCIGDKRSRQ
jgi:hypothetical protein